MRKLTKTSLKNEEVFIMDSDLKRGKLKAIKPKGFIHYVLVNALLPDSAFQVCNITSIDKEGFNYFELYLGNVIKGRVLFKNCFQVNINETDVEIIEKIQSHITKLKIAS